MLLFISNKLIAQTVKENQKEILIGVDPYYAPFEYKGPGQKLAGFDIDLGNLLCKKINISCRWVEIDFDGLIAQLQTNKIDAILSSLSITEKRLRTIGFSHVLYRVPSRLIAKKSAHLSTSIELLQGKRIGVLSGTTQEIYAKTFWRPHNVKIIAYRTQDLIYQDLKAGRLDAAFQDEPQAKFGFLNKQKNLPVNSDNLNNEFILVGERIDHSDIFGKGVAVGLRKNDIELKSKFDEAIKSIDEKTFKDLQLKHFNEVIF